MAKRRGPIGIGLVGLGFMGVTHLQAAKKIKGGRLVAVADSDPRRARGDFSKVQGNFGQAGTQEDFTKISSYQKLEESLVRIERFLGSL